MAIFRAEGRSTRWKRLDLCIKNSLEVKKAAHFEEESAKLRSMGRSHQWYVVLSKMLDDESLKAWSVGDLAPDKPQTELAEELALHFTDITNKSSPLLPEEIPQSRVDNVLIPQLVERTVAEKLTKYKIPSSTVPGDIPKGLSRN